MSDNQSANEGTKLKFDALKMKYDDQVALLRFLTTFDFKIFSGFLTIQLAFASWSSSHTIKGSEVHWKIFHHKIHLLPSQTVIATKIGLLIIDALLGLVAARLLHANKLRRTAIVGIVRNLNEAFGFTTPGLYLPERAINVDHTYRPWAYLYIFVILMSYTGIVLIMLVG